MRCLMKEIVVSLLIATFCIYSNTLCFPSLVVPAVPETESSILLEPFVILLFRQILFG